MKTNQESRIAETAEQVAKNSAEVSLNAAEVAAKARIKEARQDLMEKINQGKSTASGYIDKTKEKLQDYAAKALNDISDEAADLADKVDKS